MIRIVFFAVLFLPLVLSAQHRCPPTGKKPHTDWYHGVPVEDPYRWLENDTSAETAAWVRRQQACTQSYLDALPDRDAWKERIAALYNYPRYGLPFRKDPYYYFTRNSGLQNQSVLLRQRGLDGPVDTVLDPNRLSPDGTTRLVRFSLSKDGRYAVWGVSRGGSDWQTWFVRDMQTMRDLPDSVRWIKISDIAWHENGFYYSRYPAPEPGKELSSRNERHQIWYHRIGTPQELDSLVYDDPANPQRFHTVYASEDERYLFLSIRDRGKGLDGNALWYHDHWGGYRGFKPIVDSVGAYRYGVVEALSEGQLIIATTAGAPNTRVDLFNTRTGKWDTLIPEQPQPLESVTTAGGRLFLRYLDDVASRVYMYSVKGKKLEEISFPVPGTAGGFSGNSDDRYVFYSFTSLNLPTRIYRLDLKTGRSVVHRDPEMSFDPDAYTTTRVFYASKDGTRIPLFLVHRKDLQRSNGPHPVILYGYGGFNISITPGFTASLVPWLEQGGIYAVANIRGGAEYGERWHQAGMLGNKHNVFEDFIAAAEFLVREGYTDSSLLAIRGASNGGLLVGAVMNQRPGLFRVAVPEVGVMDMLRFHKFTIGWNWVAEYGSSEDPEAFRYLYAYSPLHNIREGAPYPATLIVTADHDDRVVPAHSFKYAATLQEKYKGENPILLRVESKSGHGASNTQKNIAQAADIYSFIHHNMGLRWRQPLNKTK